MGRPTTIDDERILEAARDVFLKRGVNATTAEVARRAGISQASIFKHFKSKQRLFLAAMQTEQHRQDWLGVFERKKREAGVEEALVALGVTIAGFFLHVLPLVLVSWSNRGEFGLPEGMSKRVGPHRVALPLVAALGAEMKAGRLRRHDPWLVTRTFIGAMQSYALVQHVFKGTLGPPYSPEQFVRGVVGLLWEGLKP